jgi:hypothetical protein
MASHNRPLLREVPGFRAYCALDAGGGVIVSISVFQDQAGSEESTKRAADYVRENLASLLPNPPQVTAGEVVASGRSRSIGHTFGDALRGACYLARHALLCHTTGAV